MPNKTDKALMSRYADPAFYNSPSASSLPYPKFLERLWSGSGAPSSSEEFNTKSKPVSVTPETKSPDAEIATSALKAQDKSIDMKPEATLTASVQQRVVSDDLDKQVREERERLWHRVSELQKLRRHQNAIIDQVESQTTNTTLRYAPQPRVEPQEQESAIPANVQHAALQICTSQLIQATAQRAVEALAEYKRSTDHLQQVTIQRLQRNLAKQGEIEQEGLFVDEKNTPDEQ